MPAVGHLVLVKVLKLLTFCLGDSTEDLCVKILVLKLLYVLFIAPQTRENFHTNELYVIVDVFLRELLDLDEKAESVRPPFNLYIQRELTPPSQLRQTFLRVLHPLLTKTQLRTHLYKPLEVMRALERLVEDAKIREIDPTTRRLAERCLSGDWRVQLKRALSTPHSPYNEPYSAASTVAVAAESDLNIPRASPPEVRISDLHRSPLSDEGRHGVLLHVAKPRRRAAPPPPPRQRLKPSPAPASKAG